MFRLTPRSAIELSLAVILGLIGLTLFVGTTDEYKAGRAFDKAMYAYAARDIEGFQEGLNEAIAAKRGYDAPQEAYGKLLIDEAKGAPAKYDEARRIFEDLLGRQEAPSRPASLAVYVGHAVAELEAVRARQPTPEGLRAALREAHSRLEHALSIYPDAGDLHVSLASIALLEGDTARCEKHLEKVVELGNISVDALPFLYNLKGVAALRGGRFPDAAVEFEKVREFAPDWDVPYLNLCAAQAQGIMRAGADAQAAAFVRAIRSTLGRLEKSRSPLYGLVCQAVAVYYIRQGDALSALSYLQQAEARGPLAAASRFNRAVAEYLATRGRKRSTAESASLLESARRELARVLDDPRAARTDTFAAAAILGTIDAEAGKAKGATAHFERAVEAAAGSPDPFVRQALPRVHRSLAALYCAEGKYKEAIPHLEKGQGGDEEGQKAAGLLKQLRTPPTIEKFSVAREKFVTDHDLRISAQLLAPATPQAIAPGSVALALAESLTATSQPIPFRLDGAQLYAVALNLPQGRFRVELRLADAIGNRATATSEEFEVDREPPRILERDPAPDATVSGLQLVRFRLHDTVSRVDLSTLKVSLRYPAGAALTARLLLSRGKYLYSRPGAQNQSVENDVRCPVPAPTPPGKYRVLVQVADTVGKVRDAEWSFVLAPQGSPKP